MLKNKTFIFGTQQEMTEYKKLNNNPNTKYIRYTISEELKRCSKLLADTGELEWTHHIMRGMSVGEYDKFVFMGDVSTDIIEYIKVMIKVCSSFKSDDYNKNFFPMYENVKLEEVKKLILIGSQEDRLKYIEKYDIDKNLIANTHFGDDENFGLKFIEYLKTGVNNLKFGFGMTQVNYVLLNKTVQEESFLYSGYNEIISSLRKNNLSTPAIYHVEV